MTQNLPFQAALNVLPTALSPGGSPQLTWINALKTGQKSALIGPGDHAAAMLDADGWPIYLPPNVAWRMFFHVVNGAWPAPYSGPFRLYYAGTGVLKITWKDIKGGNTRRLVKMSLPSAGAAFPHGEHGGIDVPQGAGQLELRIDATDLDGKGEYLRRLAFVHEDHVSDWNMGYVTTPEFRALHGDAGAIRWMEAQDAKFTPKWAEGDYLSAPVSRGWYQTYAGHARPDGRIGAAIPAILAAAAEMGQRPWLCVPANASDAFIEGVFDEILQSPVSVADVELGNENWNAFESSRYARAQAEKRWGLLVLDVDAAGQVTGIAQDGWLVTDEEIERGGYKHVRALNQDLQGRGLLSHTVHPYNQGAYHWTALRTAEMARIRERVGGAASRDRIKLVLGVHGGYGPSSRIALSGSLWRAAEPNDPLHAGFPQNAIDRVAAQIYAGNDIRRFAGPSHGEPWNNMTVHAGMLKSLVKRLGHAKQHVANAAKFGLPVDAYEAGPHLLAGGDPEAAKAFGAYQDSAEMEDLAGELLLGAYNAGFERVFWFGDCGGGGGRFGWWGAVQNMRQTLGDTAKGRALLDFMPGANGTAGGQPVPMPPPVPPAPVDPVPVDPVPVDPVPVDPVPVDPAPAPIDPAPVPPGSPVPTVDTVIADAAKRLGAVSAEIGAVASNLARAAGGSHG